LYRSSLAAAPSGEGAGPLGARCVWVLCGISELGHSLRNNPARRSPPGPVLVWRSAMSETRRAGDPEMTTYRDVQLSPDFSELRRRFRRFVFPMTGLFLVWYFVYVLLADYAHGFMSHKIGGNITVALIFGLLQFVSTFAITLTYVRWADRKIDPEAEQLRNQIEGGNQ
jgi:uncharacterized membrane protein (DUF485 family)